MRIFDFTIAAALTFASGYSKQNEAATTGNASPVSAEAANFIRCHLLLTGHRPKASSDLLIQVKSGTLGATDACISLITAAELSDDHQLESKSMSAKLLRTMNDFHQSWFRTRRFDTSLPLADLLFSGTSDIYDPNQPALHLTRALLGKNAKYSDIVTLKNDLEAIRIGHPQPSNLPPFFPPFSDSVRWPLGKRFFGVAPEVSRWTDVSFVSQGELVGVKSVRSLILPRGYIEPQTDENEVIFRNVDVMKSFGAGILGTPPYILLTIKEVAGYRSLGGLKLPRRWSEALVGDLLCRDLPVLKQKDVQSFVVPDSPIVFRRSASCITCHATLDQMASTIRSVRYLRSSDGSENSAGLDAGLGSIHLTTYSAPLEANSDWPAFEEPQYANRESKGRLFFRNYKDQLIDIPVADLSQLGEALSKQTDLYLCAAKRYYEYFTGFKVDPLATPLSPQAREVIVMADRLKDHQTTKELLRDIFNSPTFRGEAK